MYLPLMDDLSGPACPERLDLSSSTGLARMFHELLSRDCGDGCDTGQPQGVGSEPYVAGSDTRGRPEGRSDTRSQQATLEISGLVSGSEA
jgi:hypothetical protein